MGDSLTAWVWTFAQHHELGKTASADAISVLSARLRRALTADPRRFAEGWPEQPNAIRRCMCVTHAVCMLEPRVASDLLEMLSDLPGFDVEARTSTGVTPVVAAVYNKFPDRRVLVETLLRLGANPNSPCDTRRKRKPALAHVFSATSALFSLKQAFQPRPTIDTDTAQLLLKHGAHCGAAYHSRPPVTVQEYRPNNRSKWSNGHCLPVRDCYRWKLGHAYDLLEEKAENPHSPSVRWVDQLLRHNRRVYRGADFSFERRDISAERAARLCREIPKLYELPSPVVAGSRKLALARPSRATPMYGPIKREVIATILALRRTGVVPEELHLLILNYLVGTTPYVGFYDETRLARMWGRQRSPFVDRGYLIRQLPTPPPADVAVVDGIHAELQQSLCQLTELNLVVPVDPEGYRDFAEVAAALFGATSSATPAACNRVLNSRLRMRNEYFADTPEELHQRIIHRYMCSAGSSAGILHFAGWFMVYVLTCAVRRLIGSVRAGATKPIQLSVAQPLTPAQVNYLLSQMNF